MIIAMLIVYGLALGSFVNALVWRIHEQSKASGRKKTTAKSMQKLSISKGRSMCPNCNHVLSAKDLVPVLSWLSLGGKCRYCHKPISVQYPIVELLTAVAFVVSYVFWPQHISGAGIAVFLLWLVLLVGFMALIVYDLRWMLLPNRIVYPLTAVAALQALISVIISPTPLHTALSILAAVGVGGGLFYVLFQLSAGKWIGGGDVKLGWLIGLSLGTPAKALLYIFIASLLGTLASLPLLSSKKLSKKSLIPFGPFLIIGAILTQLFGDSLISWYRMMIIGG